MVGDYIEHIRSTVWLSHVGNLKRAVLGSWRSQILHPAAVGWLLENAVTVEDVSEEQREVFSFLGPCEVQMTEDYRCSQQDVVGPGCDTAAVLQAPHLRCNVVPFCLFPSFTLGRNKCHSHNNLFERRSLFVLSPKCRFETETESNLERCLLYSTWAGRPCSCWSSLGVWGKL